MFFRLTEDPFPRCPVRRVRPALAGLLLLAVSALPSAAGDDVVIVPREQASIELPEAWLLADDGAAMVVDLTSTSRGTLTREAGRLVYQPSQAFWDAGSDWFRYGSEQSAPLAYRVHLVADLREELFAGDPFTPACQVDAEEWTAVGEPTLGAPSPGSEGCALVGVGASADPAFLATRTGQSGPGGGNTSMTLEPGGGSPPTTSVSFAAAVTAAGEVVFELSLEPGPALVVQGRQADGSYVSTGPLPVAPAFSKVSVTWWLASEPAAGDGGLFVTVGGELLGSAVGIDNFAFSGGDWQWRFGQLDAGSEASGGFVLIDPAVWTSDRLPVFEPRFADGGESGDLGVWSFLVAPSLLKVDGPGGCGDAVIAVSVPASGTAALGDISAAGSGRYRARFALDTGTLSLPGGSTLTVFRAPGTLFGTEDPFRVELRRLAAGKPFEIRAAGAHGTSSSATPWRRLPGGDEVEVTLEWWNAEDAARPGGIRLWLDGVLSGASSLDNPGQRVSTTLLGAVAAPAGAAGRIAVDDFEAWR